MWVESNYVVKLGFKKKRAGGKEFGKKAFACISSLLIEYGVMLAGDM